MISSHRFKKTVVRILQWAKKNARWINAVIIILIYTLVYEKLVDGVIVKYASPLLAVTSSWWHDFLFFLLLGSSLFSIASVLVFRRSSLKGDSIMFYLLLASFVYLLPRFGLLHTTTSSFTAFGFIPSFAYADAVFICLLQFITRKNLKKQTRPARPLPGTPDVMEDDLYGLQGIDILRRTPYAQLMARIISNKKTKSAFAIAIKGDWGSGKSVFLRQIKNNLFRVIRVEFNPWMSKSVKRIIPDFFRLLVSQTIDYDRSLSRRFERYSEALNKVDEKYSEKLFSVFGLIKKSLKEESLEIQAREIVRILKKEKLKIVVFIDDLDRLGGDEIMAVLKLIRNSFNFPNTFFVVACDDRYIQRTIKDKVDHPGRFMEKIFQLEIDLPSFPVELVEQQTLDLLSRDKPAERIQTISAALSYIFSAKITATRLKNLRDAIRFANSVNHLYAKKADEVDLVDFFLLELLKLKNKDIFADIRDCLLRNTGSTYLYVPQTSTEKDYGTVKFAKESTSQKKLEPDDEQFLNVLFNRPANFDEIKSIRYLRNALRYFSDDLFGNISYADLDSMGDETFDRFRALIEKNWDSNLEQLTALLLRVSPRLNINEFKNLVRGLLYISGRQNFRQFSRVLIGIIENGMTALPPPAFEQALEGLLVNDAQDPFAESVVLGELLQKRMTDPGTQFPLKQTITGWLLRNLQSFVRRHADRFDPLVYDIYYQLVDHSEQGHSVMNSEGNRILRDYIMANQTAFFQDWLIRPKYISNFESDIYVLEPFIPQYLGYDKFEELLFQQEPDPAVTRIQGFFTKFKAENFTECSYDPKVIEIFSDEHTRFKLSPTYPTFQTDRPAITAGKLQESKKYPTLAYSKWITRNSPLTLTEAVEGGVYLFTRAFSLSAPEKNLRAAIHFLVDDYLTLKINNSLIDLKYNGWHQLHTVEIGELLLAGQNEITFIVENVSMDAEKVAQRPENNPYEFIYYIKVWEA